MNSVKFEATESPQSSVDIDGASPITAGPRKPNPKRGTRTPHSKSRGGCVTCKRRKVKCDEQRPSCFNCTRLRGECEYPVLPIKNSSGSRVESPHVSINDTCGINIVDLELLYVYSTSTYSTLSMSSSLREFWRITVPQLAIENRFLMGEILALSALHLAHHRREQRHHYLSTALSHHQAASEEAIELLKNVTKENAAGLFVFSALTIVIAMATPKRLSSSDIPTEEGSFEDWIYLIQGTKELRDNLGAEYPESSLAPLFSFTRERWEFHYCSDSFGARSNDMLCELHDRINASVDNTELLNIFVERIGSLRSAASHTLDWEGMDVFFWLYGCIDGFFPLVKARNQVAWVILAYFCLMLKKAETQWWLQGWADRTMREIHEQLDDEHKRWILRPAEELGWIAPRG